MHKNHAEIKILMCKILKESVGRMEYLKTVALAISSIE